MAGYEGNLGRILNPAPSGPSFDVAELYAPRYCGESSVNQTDTAPKASNRSPNEASYGGEDAEDRKVYAYFRNQRKQNCGEPDDTVDSAESNSAFFRHPVTGKLMYGVDSDERKKIMTAAWCQMDAEKQKARETAETQEADAYFRRECLVAGKSYDSPSTISGMTVNFKTGKTECMSSDETEQHNISMRVAYREARSKEEQDHKDIEVEKYFARKQGRKHESQPTDSALFRDPETGELKYGLSKDERDSLQYQAYLRWEKETEGGSIDSFGRRNKKSVASIKMHKLDWGTMAS